MKKIILLILLAIPLLLSAQPSQSISNNTATLLDSSATWNGTLEQVNGDYNWLVVVVRSNIGSATNGLVVRWTNKSSGATIWKTAASRTYTANDTTTNTFWFPVVGSYFRVSYTNDTTDQTSFTLTTYLNQNTIPTTSTGKVDINGTVTVTGVAQDSSLVDIQANQTNGTQRSIPVNGSNSIIGVQTSPFYFKPDSAHVLYRDLWAIKDTTTYNFKYAYLHGYFSAYDSSATLSDSLLFEYYSEAKQGWTTQQIRVTDEYTGYDELNTVASPIIIPASTVKTFKISLERPGQIRIRPKTVVGRTAIKTMAVTIKGVN